MGKESRRLMGVVITENEVLEDGNQWLSDFELMKASRNSRIMNNYKL